MSASEDIAARRAKYARIERQTDTDGRCIGVKRLTPSQQIAVQEMAPNLDGTVAETTDDGKVVYVPKSMPLTIAASVCEIDGDPIPFPRNRAELNSIIDRLDSEGLTAATIALGKFAPKQDAGQEKDQAAVKN